LKPIPDPKPVVSNYTPKPPTSLPIYITRVQATTASELPTPPPYTGSPIGSTTKNFMWPSKKPEATTATTAKYGRINPCPNGRYVVVTSFCRFDHNRLLFRPLANEFDSPMTCNFVVRPNGGCPEDYWCHTGSSYATTACCPIIKWGMCFCRVGKTCLLCRRQVPDGALKRRRRRLDSKVVLRHFQRAVQTLPVQSKCTQMTTSKLSKI
jgi:hypothetical protein